MNSREIEWTSHIFHLVKFVYLNNFKCKIVCKNDFCANLVISHLQYYDDERIKNIEVISWEKFLEELKNKDIKFNVQMFGHNMIDGYILSICDEEFKVMIKEGPYNSNQYWQDWLETYSPMDCSWCIMPNEYNTNN